MELERLSIYGALSDAQRSALASLRPVSYPVGAALFDEGDYGDRLYLILSGRIAVLMAAGTRDERLLGVQSAGEVLGEMSFFSDDGRRSASARVLEAAEVLELSRSEFDTLIAQEPALAYEMLRMITRRFRQANDSALWELRQRNERLESAYIELQRAQAQLVEQERMAHEMQLARRIQANMLPAMMPALAGYQLGAMIVPAREVGGDFYDVFDLDDERLALVVGDVCGKGVPAALYMAQTRSLVRAEAGRGESPETTLRQVNRLLLGLNPGSSMFVTMLLAVLHRSTRELLLVRAGHDLPAGWGADDTPLPIELGLGHPLGLIDDPALDVQQLTLAPGATLLLYTDGVTESADERGEFFGTERLQQLGIAIRAATAQALCDRLVAEIAVFRGAAPQADDITMLALRVA